MFVVAWVSTANLTAFFTSGDLVFERVEYARCEQTGECEIFIRIQKQVMITTFLRRLKQAGFSSISWHTYPKDHNDHAARSILRINSLSNKKEYTHGKFGSHSPHLVSMVKTVSKRKILEEVISDENDVVKKRKQIDAAESSEQDQFSTEGFSHFLSFERNTRLALLRAIQADDVATRTIELTSYQPVRASKKSTKTSGSGGGGVYVAKCSDIDAHKIGATLRSDPQLRLNELSRLVSVPFQLVLWIPCADPFQLERSIHRFFDRFRVRIPDVSTEFFTVEEQDVKNYLESRNQEMTQKLEKRLSFKQALPGLATAAAALAQTHTSPSSAFHAAVLTNKGSSARTHAPKKQRTTTQPKPASTISIPTAIKPTYTHPFAHWVSREQAPPGLATAAASLTYMPKGI